MIFNKELHKNDSKLKVHNPYLHQYISAVTDFDNEMHCAYIGNIRSQFHKIGVLLENVIHDMNKDEATDILTDIVSTLFDYHFKGVSIEFKKHLFDEMLQVCFERLDEDERDWKSFEEGVA